MSQSATLGARLARTSRVNLALVGVPLAGITVIFGTVASDRGADALGLATAALVAAAAGLSATVVGVFGGVLVPGLLLLGIEPRVAAPLSLLLQVIVIPLGAVSHAALGNVRRPITAPLIVGGVVGSVTGALLASAVPPLVSGRVVSGVIVVVGLIILASLRSGGVGSAERGQIHPLRVGGIGVVAGIASGISGAGWGPIGVKLLILSRIDPRHAIGSSLVGRVAMAVAAVVTYALASLRTGGVGVDLRLLVVLLAGSAAAMVPGSVLIGRLDRRRAAAAVALLSIGLALPSLLRGGR